jgi:hypothetical protein
MATQAQIDANRQNAKLSSGPSEEGPYRQFHEGLFTAFVPSEFGFVWSEEEIFQSVSQMKLRQYAREAQSKVDELDYNDVPKAA